MMLYSSSAPLMQPSKFCIQTVIKSAKYCTNCYKVGQILYQLFLSYANFVQPVLKLSKLFYIDRQILYKLF